MPKLLLLLPQMDKLKVCVVFKLISEIVNKVKSLKCMDTSPFSAIFTKENNICEFLFLFFFIFFSFLTAARSSSKRMSIVNSLTTKKQTTKFSSANFQKVLSPSYIWETARYRLKYCLKGPLNPKQNKQPSYIILRIQRLEGKQCGSR